MELNTEIEKHKKTVKEMEDCFNTYLFICSEKGGCHSHRRKDPTV